MKRKTGEMRGKWKQIIERWRKWYLKSSISG